MEIRVKTIYIVIVAIALFVGVFFLGQLPQKRMVKAQAEQISAMQSEIIDRDSIIAGQQIQLSQADETLGEIKERNDLLQTRNAAKDKQIINLRYSVAKLSDSITFILNNTIECPICDPVLPAIYLPFMFNIEEQGVLIEGLFDEDAMLSVRIKTEAAVDTIIYEK